TPRRKTPLEAFHDEPAPDSVLGRAEIVPQEPPQEILPYQKVRNPDLLQAPFDLVRMTCAPDRPDEQGGKFAAVVKIGTPAIIRPPADKEKINLGLLGRLLVDVTKCGI